MKIIDQYKKESDLVSGILTFLLLFILFKIRLINLPLELDSAFLLNSFITLFGITLAILTVIPVLNPKIFKIAEKKQLTKFLRRTFTTPLIASFIGVILSLLFSFYTRDYLFSLIIGTLIYVLLSLIEFFRFVYYIKSKES